MTDRLENIAKWLLSTRTDEADGQGQDADLKYLREGRDALRRSGFMDIKPDGQVEAFHDPVRALGGAGANFVGQAAMGAGAPILGGALAGAGAAQLEGADAKHTAVAAGLGAALPALMEAPAVAKGLWARLAAPVEAKGPQLALAGAGPSYRPPRGASPATQVRPRTAIAPNAGSIPPEYSPTIPKHDRPLVSESMLPAADDMANTAYEAVGQKKLAEHGVGAGTSPEVGARYGREAAVLDEAYPLKRAPREVPLEPVTGTRTVRPGRARTQKAPPAPKLPSETGAVPRDAEQVGLQFPEDTKPAAHWLEGELVKPSKIAAIKNGGINSSFKVDFPEGRSAVYKPQSGAVPMPEVGISPASVPDRERAMSDIGEAYFGSKSPVPKTVARDLPGRGRGSLQEFVPETVSADKFEAPAVSNTATAAGEDLSLAPDYQSGHGPARDAEIASLAADPSHQRTFVLDAVGNNPDRHAGNLLLKGPDAVAIDNGLAFGYNPKRIFVDRARPFYNQEYNQGVSKLQPEVAREARDVSLKKLTQALSKDGNIKPEQVRDTLARARDFSYDPNKLAGKTAGEIDQWTAPSVEKRGMSGPDLNEIDKLTGVNPAARYAGKGIKPLEGVKPLEGEQLTLTDLLSKLR